MAEPGLERRRSGSRACGGTTTRRGLRAGLQGEASRPPPRPEWPRSQEEAAVCEQPVDLAGNRDCVLRGDLSARVELCFAHAHPTASRERTGRWTTAGGPAAGWAELVAVAVGLTTRGCRRQRVMPGARGRQKALAVATDQLD